MIWQAPWAWAGLLAVLLPILIHLLGRGDARVQPFPTLRFLEPSRLLPTRRTRLHDLLLLAVRVGILTMAVAALAQPLIQTANRKRTLDATLARAIVIDTSASMLRATSAGQSAIDSARRAAESLVHSAQIAMRLESGSPGHAIAGAVAWLSRQSGHRELIVVSDFQLGALDARDLALVPPEIGIHLVRIGVLPATTPITTTARSGDADIVARITPGPDYTDVQWTARPASVPADSTALLLLAGPGDAGASRAALYAAEATGTPWPGDTNHPVAIVFPGAAGRADLLRDAKPLQTPWMTDVVASLRGDSTLIAAASSARLSGADSIAGLVVARTDAGAPVAIAAHGTVRGRDRLLLFARFDAGSLAAAALIAGTLHGASHALPVSELETATVPDSTLAHWQRLPAAAAIASPSGAHDSDLSDGRWFWLAALVLIAIETWIRRAPSSVPGARMARDHVA